MGSIAANGDTTMNKSPEEKSNGSEHAGRLEESIHMGTNVPLDEDDPSMGYLHGWRLHLLTAGWVYVLFSNNSRRKMG